MSKILVPFNNIRFRLSEIFHHDLLNRKDDVEEMSLAEMRELMAYCYGDDYVEYYDEDGEVIFPSNEEWLKRNKRSKKGKKNSYDDFWEKEERKHKRKHRKGKKARMIDISIPFSGEEDEYYSAYEDLGYDNGVTDGKEIYYYPDYHDKDNRLEFSTLKDFVDFCEDNGYTVPEHILNDIAFRRISHTCLMPEAKEYGIYEIMAEDSYGTLYYEVCEASELD